MNFTYRLLISLIVFLSLAVSANAEAFSYLHQVDTLTSEKKERRNRLTNSIKEHPPVFNKKDSIRARLRVKTDDFITAVFPEDTVLNMKKLRQKFDDSPSFGIYKNNYIIGGTSLGAKPDRFNSDAKIQVSISQRMTNSVLPFQTYLFLTYTQLAYWDIFRESFPFGDINFNPTVGLGRAIVYNNRLIGLTSLQLEHESNGKDEDYSRSWNKVSLSCLLAINPSLSVQGKIWIPIIDGQNNRDIAEYKGWGFLGMEYNHKSDFSVGLSLTKRNTPDLSANIMMNMSLRLSKSSNQFLFLEYYNGYGESLIDYDHYHHRLRIGIVLKPTLFSFY